MPLPAGKSENTIPLGRKWRRHCPPGGLLVVSRESVRLLPVSQSAIYDRLIDAVPQLLDRIQGMVQGERTTDGVVRTTYKV